VRPYTLGRTWNGSDTNLALLRCNLFSSQTMQLSKIKPRLSGENRRDASASSKPPRPAPSGMVGVPGIEPGTSSLSGTRSNQLSYTPGRMVEAAGVEPATSSLQSWRSTN
jgi:hypothetical protein